MPRVNNLSVEYTYIHIHTELGFIEMKALRRSVKTTTMKFSSASFSVPFVDLFNK